ncbi:cytochrome P450 [Lyophyllum atratum]|nr:cytochrome P450 [Lyophyllum atratum]
MTEITSSMDSFSVKTCMDHLVFRLSGLLVITSIGFLVKRWFSLSTRLPYPPGPQPRWISGNSHDLPTTQPWLTYSRWAKQYGSIFHFREYHQHVIMVSSLKDAVALFEKRSQNYSDRPVTTMVELMGFDFNIGFIPYGDKWRRHRRLFQQHFKKEVSANYQPVQSKKIYEMLHDMLLTPEDFMAHHRTLAVTIMMATMYGSNISLANVNRFGNAIEQAVDKLGEAIFPGALLVNTFPFLRYLPSWLPGAGFKTFAAGCKTYTDDMLNVPFGWIKEKMACGVEVSGLAGRLLEKNDEQDGLVAAEAEEDMKEVTATAFVAGAETTTSSLGTFFYAMVMNPDKQRKAQEEIDAVIGTHRLPDYGDRESLPYVEAIYREVMRWRPVLPLGIPHAAWDEDIYNGYYIPKGSVVMANIWAMAHDESIYPEPDSFLPERFFDDEGRLNNDDQVIAFGFGRRICPGRHMASATVWLSIAAVLSTLNIAKAKDMDGKEIPVSNEYLDGLAVHKAPFRCSITPRSVEARDLIRRLLSVGMLWIGGDRSKSSGSGI